MKATKLTIRRYRAFDREVTIDLQGLTVLTGPNNLGKSTVLLALRLFFSIFSRSTPLGYTRLYELDRDYPKLYVGRRGRRTLTRIAVHFQLSKEDKEAIGEGSAASVPSEISVQAEFLPQKGRANVATDPQLPAPLQQRLFDQIVSRVRYVYIPTGRGLASGRGYERSDVQGEIGRLALAKVRNTRRRLKALEKLVEDAKDELVTLQREIADELRRYMPALKRIEFELTPPDPRQLVQVSDIMVDDGANTPLSQKGDGVKNLFAIAVLQYVARQDPGDQLILGIEEPEAHLHSEAIYKLKPQLQQLASQHHVVVTTHSPILIQRDQVDKNLIVDQGATDLFSSTIRRAKSLADIRRCLGIKPQENMTSAEVVLIAEGETERRVCEGLFRRSSAILKEAIDQGRVRVLPAQGASKVVAILRTLVRDAASCVVLLDNDEEGRKAALDIGNGGLCGAKDLFMIPNREGMEETEFEDLFPPALYIDGVNEACGTSITVEEFEAAQRSSGNRRTRAGKWSAVMKKALDARGKDWDLLREEVRSKYADHVLKNIENVNTQTLPVMTDLGQRLAALLKEEADAR